MGVELGVEAMEGVEDNGGGSGELGGYAVEEASEGGVKVAGDDSFWEVSDAEVGEAGDEAQMLV
jgi:hypothetical protein